ncbi:MAG TPA: cardiolipin synthase [Burkholderiales bacterium]|nr:cardiolipin synthase [Burkholderiales bacterium]
MLTWGTAYVISEWLVRIAMLVYVPQRRSPASARAWLLLIFFLPALGLVLYALIGRAYIPRRRLAKQARVIQLLQATPKDLSDTAQVPMPVEIAEAARLARNLGSFDLAGGNRIELLDNYQASLERLLQDIQAAQHSVHLLYYIFADDRTGLRAAQVIEQAARRGVRCRLLLDSVGSRHALRKVAPQLRAAGVEVVALLPLRPLRSGGARLDLRNHRKIAVIDGLIGYVGSQNIADDTANRGLTNEELVVRVVGPVVHQLQAVLLADRYEETGEEITDRALFPPPRLGGSCAAQVLPSGPGHQEGNTQQVLVSLIFGARRRVDLTTPYFVPDATFLTAMRTVAARGVEVNLIASRHSNKPVVQFAQQSYYEDLLAAGVRIYLYRGAFLHAKYTAIDESAALIGSSNLDIRSFALNSEVSLLVYDPRVVGVLRSIQDRHIADSDAITLSGWRQRSPARRWLQNMCRLTDTLI